MKMNPISPKALEKAVCEQRLKLFPDEGPSWLEYVVALGKLSRYADADTAFERAYELADDGNREYLYIRRGLSCQRKGDFEEAEKWLREAQKLNPRTARHLVFLGVLKFRAGELDKAEEILREATKTTAECVDEAYFNLGGVLTAKGRYEEAANCYEKAVEIDPEYQIAKNRLKDVKKALKIKGKGETL